MLFQFHYNILLKNSVNSWFLIDFQEKTLLNWLENINEIYNKPTVMINQSQGLSFSDTTNVQAVIGTTFSLYLA